MRAGGSLPPCRRKGANPEDLGPEKATPHARRAAKPHMDNINPPVLTGGNGHGTVPQGAVGKGPESHVSSRFTGRFEGIGRAIVAADGGPRAWGGADGACGLAGACGELVGKDLLDVGPAL